MAKELKLVKEREIVFHFVYLYYIKTSITILIQAKHLTLLELSEIWIIMNT